MMITRMTTAHSHCSLFQAPLKSARHRDEPALFMNTSAAIAVPLFRLCFSYLVKREARFADDARLSASPRGERAQDGKNVSVWGIFICEMDAGYASRATRFHAIWSLDSSVKRGRKLDSARDPELVEGATSCHE